MDLGEKDFSIVDHVVTPSLSTSTIHFLLLDAPDQSSMAAEVAFVSNSESSLALLADLNYAPVAPTLTLGPPAATQPPPAFDARLVTVTVSFAARLGARSRETSVQEPTLTLNGDADLNGDGKEVTSPIARQLSGAGPVLPKRRTLVSLSSLPAIPVVGLDTRPALSGLRPRTALKSTTFIKGYEGLPLSGSALKSLGPPAGGDVDWGFWTCGKSLIWADLHPSRAKEAIAKLNFQSSPTALAVASNATPDGVNVLCGFTGGDILLLDPICARYTRFNKAGCVTASTVTCLQWLPSESGQSGIFASGHADGCILVWDKERDDGTFVAPTSPPVIRKPRPVPHSASSTASVDDLMAEAAEDIVVTCPPQPAPERKGKGAVPTNPLSHWWLSRRALTDLAFSPDAQHCAVTSEDGVLRIIEVHAERLLDAYGSFFGSFTTLAWSTDGRFCATGGQDDLVCVYAPLEQRIVARCQGHTSFVSGVAFDAQRSDDRSTRFASVGDDQKLVFWDLSNASLHRPKLAHQPHLRRLAAASTLSLNRRRAVDSAIHLPVTSENGGPVWHAPPARSEVAMLQPAGSQTLSSDLLTRVAFLRDTLVVLTRNGRLLIYGRPDQAG